MDNKKGNVDISWPNAPMTKIIDKGNNSKGITIIGVYARTHNCDEYWEYSEKEESTHRKTCKVCTQTWTEPHTEADSNGKCTKCGKHFKCIMEWKNCDHYGLEQRHHLECNQWYCSNYSRCHKNGQLSNECTLCNVNAKCDHISRRGSSDGSNAGWLIDIISHYLICNDCGKSVKPIWENGIKVGYAEGEEEHYDNDGNGECDPCGFVVTAKHECSGKTLMKNLAGHWYICDCGAETKFIKENGKEIGTGLHYDDNFNGNCDLCKELFIKYCGKNMNRHQKDKRNIKLMISIM